MPTSKWQASLLIVLGIAWLTGSSPSTRPALVPPSVRIVTNRMLRPPTSCFGRIAV